MFWALVGWAFDGEADGVASTTCLSVSEGTWDLLRDLVLCLLRERPLSEVWLRLLALQCFLFLVTFPLLWCLRDLDRDLDRDLALALDLVLERWRLERWRALERDLRLDLAERDRDLLDPERDLYDLLLLLLRYPSSESEEVS